MSGGEGQGECIRLALLELNRIHQNLNHHRGEVLTAALVAKLDGHVKEASRILRGQQTAREPKPSQRRRALWRRDPRCFWCGRVTRIDAYYAPDAATVEHLYPKQHPRKWHPRRTLPAVVLACRECNMSRGGYDGPSIVRQTCSVLKDSSTVHVYRLKRRA